MAAGLESATRPPARNGAGFVTDPSRVFFGRPSRSADADKCVNRKTFQHRRSNHSCETLFEQ